MFHLLLLLTSEDDTRHIVGAQLVSDNSMSYLHSSAPNESCPRPPCTTISTPRKGASQLRQAMSANPLQSVKGQGSSLSLDLLLHTELTMAPWTSEVTGE